MFEIIGIFYFPIYILFITAVILDCNIFLGIFYENEPVCYLNKYIVVFKKKLYENISPIQKKNVNKILFLAKTGLITVFRWKI